jgi:hypothetical protein
MAMVDQAELVRRLHACDCPAILIRDDVLPVFERYHVPGCPALRKVNK